MITIDIGLTSAEVRNPSELRREPFTTGTVGREVLLVFSDEWNALAKTAVFIGSDDTRDVLITGTALSAVVVVPHEVLVKPCGELTLGVYGTNGNTIAIPTVYTSLGMIRQGADPSGDPSTDPTPTAWEQVTAALGALAEEQAEIRQDLTALDKNLDVCRNVANPLDIVPHSVYFNPANYSYNDTWSTTVVKVKPNATYTIWNAQNYYCWYSNADGENLGSIQRVEGVITTPNNCTELRLSHAVTDNFYVIEGDISRTPYYRQDVGYPFAVSKINDYQAIAADFTNNFDCNDLTDNSIKLFNVNTASVDNAPFNDWRDGATWCVSTYATSLNIFQRFFSIYGDGIERRNATRVYFRNTRLWSNWEIYAPSPLEKTIHIGANQQYTRLRDGFAAAIASPNSNVIVHSGSYDLTTEFADEIANHTARGIPLGNGIKATFMAGAYVTANFDNTDRWIYDNFQPFYSTGDFTINDLNIDASNCRYCVHDEHGGSGTYKHIYNNCTMKYTNTHTDINYVQCIGGGLGEHGCIEINGGKFESVTTVPYPGKTLKQSCQPISYHNGMSPTCDSKISVKDVYLVGDGHFRFGMYGPSTIKTPIMISGCSMGGEIDVMFESYQYDIENFELTEWNNVIRT